MKFNYKTLCIFVAVLSTYLAGAARTFTFEGLTYSVNADSTTVTLEEEGKSYRDLTILHIPQYVTDDNKEYKVTTIGKDVCAGCKKLRHVYIPNSVNRIEREAFSSAEIHELEFDTDSLMLGLCTFQHLICHQLKIRGIIATDYCEEADCLPFGDVTGSPKTQISQVTITGDMPDVGLEKDHFYIDNVTAIVVNENVTDITRAAERIWGSYKFCKAMTPPKYGKYFRWGTVHIPYLAYPAYRDTYPWSELASANRLVRSELNTDSMVLNCQHYYKLRVGDKVESFIPPKKYPSECNIPSFQWPTCIHDYGYKSYSTVLNGSDLVAMGPGETCWYFMWNEFLDSCYVVVSDDVLQQHELKLHPRLKAEDDITCNYRKDVMWDNDAPDVVDATFSESGCKVKGLTPGVATITANAPDGQTEVCKVSVCHLADFNMDTTVDVHDLNELINIILKMHIPPLLYDIDDDGLINVSDINALINTMLGK